MKSLSSHKKVSYITKWLRTCSVEIYADDPYNLPPKGPADLSLPAVYHTAENAFLQAKSLSEKNWQNLRKNRGSTRQIFTDLGRDQRITGITQQSYNCGNK